MPTEDDRRLQELLKLQFDRRPVNVLKALAKKSDGSDKNVTSDLQRFQTDVVAGDWKAVKEFLAKLPEKHAGQVYRHVLVNLPRLAPVAPPPPEPGQPAVATANTKPPEPALLPEDVLALADAKPTALDDGDADLLGKLLAIALRQGAALEPFLARLDTGTERLGGGDEKKRGLAAVLLMAAGRVAEAGQFLPPIDAAKARKDFAALDQHARQLAAVGRDQQDTPSLRGAWELTQFVLADKSAAATNRESALQRAIELLPALQKQLGAEWARRNFRDNPEQGMTILAAVGERVSLDLNLRDPEKRRANLESQRRIVDELLAVAGPDTQPWQAALNLLALGWAQEAERSKLRHVSRRQSPYNQIIDYDPSGNPIYGNYGQPYQNPNEPQFIPIETLLPTAPGDAWLAALEKSFAPKVRATLAELYMKLEQEEKALPFIEAVAAVQPRAALTLANDLLRSWAKSKDPNQGSQRNARIYYGPYGPQPAPGIPLTRAVQARNLGQLSVVLERLRQLPLPPLDEKAVIAAFAASHSQAEVFRVEDIQRVFGQVDTLKGETLAELLQAIRERLAKQWRAPIVQQQARTKRSDKEIEAQVNRGYELVIGLVDKSLATRPNDWRLLTAKGATIFDWAEFQYGKEVALAIYTEKRDAAFAALQKAARLYADKVSTMEEREQSPIVFQQWFNATLGASDLAFLTRQQQLDTNRIDLIRDAMLALPRDAAERHVAAFGRGLTESITGLPPELKPRYLKAGLRVVGDHESAGEARQLVAYYDGLLQEVALDLRVDGNAAVGHGRPFGVFLGIRHSDAVGRESGGFAKYLMNQQSQQYYYNPSGRPPVNYRDDLEKKIRETLTAGFEILSITFHDEKVEPRGYGRPDWRETPIAYLLLKAKDASVDRLPAIQLDLDFMDKRGTVVLPIESPVVLVDARPDAPPARPLSKLALAQILDERELKSGKLTLEIKASARGILPELKDLLDVTIAGFKVDKLTDQGLSVTKIDADGDKVAPVTERNWLVNLVADSTGEPAATFAFPKPKLASAELSYKRYADADIVDVKAELALAGVPIRPRSHRGWYYAAAIVVVCGGGLYLLLRSGKTAAVEQVAAYTLPAQVTPFTVLNLLRRMEQDHQLPMPVERRDELARAIRELEQDYFGPAGETNGQANLERIAREWLVSAAT